MMFPLMQINKNIIWIQFTCMKLFWTFYFSICQYIQYIQYNINIRSDSNIIILKIWTITPLNQEAKAETDNMYCADFKNTFISVQNSIFKNE
jgi:hypothetical protein